jgi:predicted aspartyl protease
LIDTGASQTCVDLDVIRSLGLEPVDEIALSTPSQVDVPTSLFAVSISFPQTTIQLYASSIEVAGVILAPQGIIALLGRDFLRGTLFIYNGPGGFFTISD